VCSEGESNCPDPATVTSYQSGGGDNNELSQLTNPEAILLTLPDGSVWVELYVSSLDSGGTSGSEEGRLYYGNTSNIADLISSGSFFDFAYNTDTSLGINIEGEIMALMDNAVKLAVSTSSYLLFTHQTPLGSANEDYLVWKGVIETGGSPPSEVVVPEPGILALLSLGLGLAGLGFTRRRIKA
jgi:hypothetical protein